MHYHRARRKGDALAPVRYRSPSGNGTINQAGYRQIVAKGHPRASTRSGYVFEHILVVESKLGRYLTPGENVHHMNGDRADNRPENLELWSTKQPCGQRTEDKVRYALEILRSYAPHLLRRDDDDAG